MATRASYNETDISGNVVTQYNYSPFGRTMTLGEDVPQPFRFTGREYDAETDFYYYRARYYSPDMRRFISEDPLRFAGSNVNFYAYVGSNPVNVKDPFGLFIAEDMPLGQSEKICDIYTKVGSNWPEF